MFEFEKRYIPPSRLKREMVVVAVTSGKGGVGKTTVSVNASILLSFFGKTLVIDGDIALPNVHAHLGLDDPFVSLLDVLKDQDYLGEAIHTIEYRIGKRSAIIDVLPASSSVKALEDVDMGKFSEVIGKLRNEYEFVVIDVAAGLSKYAIIPMLSAERTYVVINPERASIMDAHKVSKISSISGVKVGGIIVNRYRGEKRIVEQAQKMIHPEVVGIIRESKLFKKSWESGEPFVVRYPNSPAFKEILALARNLAGFKTEIKKYGKVKYMLGML